MTPRFLAIQASAQYIPLADNSVHCVVTSPPYWGLRAYGTKPQSWSDGWSGEYGSEPTLDLYVAHSVEIFQEVRRVLRDDGTVWLNIGDSYANHGAGGSGKHLNWIGDGIVSRKKLLPCNGLKAKDQVFVPHRIAMALQADGWWVRDTIIWHKPNPMPSSVTDRTTTAHEYVFLLTKSARYFYDADAIREPVTSTGGNSFGSVKKLDDGVAQGPNTRGIRRIGSEDQRNHPLGRNKRSVWTIATQSFSGAHFATFPVKLVTPCILAGTSEKGCCPSCGAQWKRVVERVREFASGSGRSGNMPVGKNGSGMQDGGETKGIQRGPVVGTVTIHWLPSCKCPAHEPIPSTVFDPFGGAMTTAVAAKRLGRSVIAIELNAEYIKIGVDRYIADAPVKVKRKRKLTTVPQLEGMLFKWQSEAVAERESA